MNHDRLSPFFRPAAFSELNEPAMPCPIGASTAPPTLVACVVHPSLMMAAQGLYQIAYENALAATRVSRFERTTTAHCN